MGTITTLYDVAFSYFFHRVSGVVAQACIIYIFRFFPLGFLKIIFVLRDVQVSVSIQICDHLYKHQEPPPHRQPPPRSGTKCYLRPNYRPVHHVPLRVATIHVLKEKKG
jgi:hypothetical protein